MRLALLIAAIFLFAAPARAARADDCVAAYDRAVQPYWLIVDDILTYQAMFDNYDRLCSHYYPGVIHALQPGADRLRAQVKTDAAETRPVMGMIVDQALPIEVPPACRADLKTRTHLKAAVLAAMAGRGKIIARRLRDDSTNLPDPHNALSVCQRLPSLAPIIEEKLGPSLAHPLLEMSVLNSHWMTGEENARAPAVDNYRNAQAVWEAKHR